MREYEAAAKVTTGDGSNIVDDNERTWQDVNKHACKRENIHALTEQRETGGSENGRLTCEMPGGRLGGSLGQEPRAALVSAAADFVAQLFHALAGTLLQQLLLRAVVFN
ncbi:hypothetical protein R1flu_027684 [Riccia fluitans]|uniref:Uncharacterized protein n=1 Tax=Riccia fluitans TaxID=41844 RepID=A0ABD1XJL9_9MARC